MSAVLLAMGDLAPDRENPDECFAETADLLHSADLVFGQLETSFASKGVRLPQARHAVLAKPEGAAALGRAGFDVVSFAGNHCMDWGYDAFIETIDNLTNAGVSVAGVGATIRDARKPVIRKLPDGTRVAILAYSSILPMNYWADERRPGCAPMRAATHYEQIEVDQPGTPARIHTFPLSEDLDALVNDIKAAKEKADIVLVSLHWGIHFVRAVIADYQRIVARIAAAAGADAILGHHAHILKGIEVIGDCPVFYSLCNFACDLRMDRAHAASKSFKEIQVLAPDWVPDFGSLYNFPPAARMSMIARLVIEKGGILEAGFLPVWIERDAVPRALLPESERFGEVVDYVSAVSKEAGFNTKFDVVENRVLIGRGAS